MAYFVGFLGSWHAYTDHFIVTLQGQLRPTTGENGYDAPMANYDRYNIHLDVLHEHLEVIDVPSIVASRDDPWWNQTLTQVNDSVVRLGVVQGEFHWHKHDNDDEFFFVISGRLFIDLEGRTLDLGPGQGATITKGVMHRPRAPEKTVMLMVETSGIIPTGD